MSFIHIDAADLTEEQTKKQIATLIHEFDKLDLPDEQDEIINKFFSIDVTGLTESEAKDMLNEIMNEFDSLDSDDFFGTEGWKHRLGFE